MTNLDYIKSLNTSDLIKFFEDFLNGECLDCPIVSICDKISGKSCDEILDIWFKMEKCEDMFKDLKVGDKFKNNENGDIYIKTANGFAFNIQTGEGDFYDTETEVCKVTDIEIKEKE